MPLVGVSLSLTLEGSAWSHTVACFHSMISPMSTVLVFARRLHLRSNAHTIASPSMALLSSSTADLPSSTASPRAATTLHLPSRATSSPASSEYF